MKVVAYVLLLASLNGCTSPGRWAEIDLVLPPNNAGKAVIAPGKYRSKDTMFVYCPLDLPLVVGFVAVDKRVENMPNKITIRRGGKEIEIKGRGVDSSIWFEDEDTIMTLLSYFHDGHEFYINGVTENGIAIREMNFQSYTGGRHKNNQFSYAFKSSCEFHPEYEKYSQ